MTVESLQKVSQTQFNNRKWILIQIRGHCVFEPHFCQTGSTNSRTKGTKIKHEVLRNGFDALYPPSKHSSQQKLTSYYSIRISRFFVLILLLVLTSAFGPSVAFTLNVSTESLCIPDAFPTLEANQFHLSSFVAISNTIRFHFTNFSWLYIVTQKAQMLM